MKKLLTLCAGFATGILLVQAFLPADPPLQSEIDITEAERARLISSLRLDKGVVLSINPQTREAVVETRFPITSQSRILLHLGDSSFEIFSINEGAKESGRPATSKLSLRDVVPGSEIAFWPVVGRSGELRTSYLQVYEPEGAPNEQNGL